jgi:carbamoyl-phosphate synthase large subunit
MNKKILITSIGCAPASSICRSLNKDYYIVGIDIQEKCVGNFICNKFISIPIFNTEKYWEKINDIIKTENISSIFVTTPLEGLEWSLRKENFKNLFNCEVYLNDPEFINITNCKKNMYKFCLENNIKVPLLKNIYERPIIIKPINGCGSFGIQILKQKEDIGLPFNEVDNIIQEYINGDEYTVDVLSDLNSNIISIVPKKRLLIKNGQSFKSIIIKNNEIINFVKDVCIKLKNKSAINVQVIQEKETNNIYLIEVNPRFSTTISLTIESGIHIPKMLIEKDYNIYDFKENLLMIRDYKEYFSIEL